MHNATTTISNSVFEYNGSDGLYIYIDSGDGLASLFMQNNVIIRNGDDGVEVYADGVTYDLNMGNATAGTAGYNSIYGNNMNAGGAFDLNNTSAESISAENNWWGTTTPAAGQFNGTVDYDPWLSADPN